MKDSNMNIYSPPPKKRRKWLKWFFSFIIIILFLALISVLNITLHQDSFSKGQVGLLKDPVLRPTNVNLITKDPISGLSFEGGTILVTTIEGISPKQLAEAVEVINGEIVGSVEEINLYEIAVPFYDYETITGAIDVLKENAIFRVVSPNYIPKSTGSRKIPDVPQWKWFFLKKWRWGQEYINMPQAWTITTGGLFRVAVIDIGFDLNHQDLEGNSILSQVDMIDWHEKRARDINHGTSVASLIGASALNKKGIAGIMWQPRLICYQISSWKDVIAALYDAYVIQGVRVANISLATEFPEKENLTEAEKHRAAENTRLLLEDMIRYVGQESETHKGMIIVAGAGNDKEISADYHYPAAFALTYDHVISVGAIDEEGLPYNEFSTGESVTLAAPGVDIWTACNARRISGNVYLNNYCLGKGTSLATPMVAGVAGLMLANTPELRPSQVKEIMIQTARPYRYQVLGLGSGIVDAFDALSEVIEEPDPVSEEITLRTPNLTMPANRSIVENNDLDFQWQSVEGAVRYKFEIVDAADKKQIITEVTGSESLTLRKKLPLEKNDYLWRVAAGTKDQWGPWAEYYQFTIEIAVESAARFRKLSDPDILPPRHPYDVVFSHDSTYLALAHSVKPYLTIYKREGNAFRKMADPLEPPSGVAYGVTFSHDSQYLAVVHAMRPYITIYRRDGDNFIKLPDPSILPGETGQNVDFSHDSTYLAVAHWVKPFLTIYKRSGDSFVKLEDPSELPPTSCTNVAFSHKSDYLAATTLNQPYIIIYKREGDSFIKLPAPSEPAAVRAYGLSFSHDSSYLAVASEHAPRITIFARSGDMFSKLNDPSEIPGFKAENVAFSHDSKLLAVANWGAAKPPLVIYQRAGDHFTKLPDPDELPAGNGYGVAFSHDSSLLAVTTNVSPYIYIYAVEKE